MHDGFDVFGRLHARRVQAIGAGSSVGAQAPDRLVQRIGMADEETFRAADQQHVLTGGIDRRTRGAHPRDRFVEGVQRLRRVAGRILDRQPGDAGVDATADVLLEAVEVTGVAVLEIRVDRQIGRLDDVAAMRQHCVDAHRVVGPCP